MLLDWLIFKLAETEHTYAHSDSKDSPNFIHKISLTRAIISQTYPEYHYLVADIGFSKYHCHIRPKPSPKASSKGSWKSSYLTSQKAYSCFQIFTPSILCPETLLSRYSFNGLSKSMSHHVLEKQFTRPVKICQRTNTKRRKAEWLGNDNRKIMLKVKTTG